MHSRSSSRLMAAGLAMSSAFALVSCGPKAVPPVAGYEPLEAENKASLPSPMDGDEHPEIINVVVDPKYADNETGDGTVGWGHGQGYIHANIKDVWAAAQKVEVIVDRRNLTKWEFGAHDTDSTADVSFQAKLQTKSVVNVDYTTQWRQKATVGSKDAPETVVLRDDLTKPVDLVAIGTIMTTISDSIILTKVDESTTAIAIIRHLQVLQPQEPGQYLKDLFASLKASAHGQSLPTY